MKKEILIIRSGTWLGEQKLEIIQQILDETIEDFVKDERIINIEVKETDSGLMRFWIYLEKINYPNSIKKV
ncbi:MAG TPA: hypothetical protein VMV95_01285 [Bacillota bacterium]|nr:hypothetical protein [Bacillota bacterium]